MSPQGFRGLEAAPPYRPGARSFLVLLLLLSIYMLALVNLTLPVRIGIVAALLAGVWFAASPRMESALLVLPFLLVVGAKEFSLRPFNPMIATLVGFAFTGLWIIDKALWDHSLRAFDHPGIRLALLAMLMQSVSIAISVSVLGEQFWNAVREGSSDFLMFPMVLIMAEACTEPRRMKAVLRSLVLALLVAGLVGVLQYVSSSGLYRVDINIGYFYKARVGSFFKSANVFAGYLELMVPVAVATAFLERQLRWKMISAAAAFLGFLSVLFTFSRGGFFMTTGMVGLVLVYQFRSRIFIPILAAVLFTAVMARNADTFARQLSLVTSPTDIVSQPTLLHRAITYRSSWQAFTAHPVTGIGWGSEEFYWGRSILYSFWDIRHRVGTTDVVHFGGLNSLFLNSALKGGLFSIAAVLLILASAFVSSRRALERPGGLLAVGLVAGLLGLTGHQLVDNLIRTPQVNAFMWIQIGLLCALRASASEMRGLYGASSNADDRPRGPAAAPAGGLPEGTRGP